MVERLQPLVGRSRELRHLSQALEGVAEGQGSSVLVVGEAGLGKSRLLEASAHGAQGAGFTTAWGRCWEAGEAPAFWPWTQVLRAVLRDRPGAEASLGAYRRRLFAGLLPELQSSPAPEDGTPFELFDVVARWLCEMASIRPLWLGLEDLHAADLASLGLVDHLTRLLRSAPILLVGAARETDFAPEPREVFWRAAREATLMRPSPLEEEEVREYVRQTLSKVTPETMTSILRATEGNALFMVELVRWLQQAGPDAHPETMIPPTVRATITHRLSRLDDDTRRALALAALVGREIVPARVEGAFGLPVMAALQTAADHHLGFPTAQGWRFSHGVIADVLVRSLSPEEARKHHGQYADHLAERREGPSAELAHHYGRAGPERRSDADRAYLESARVALDRHAHADALRLASEISIGPFQGPAQVVMGLAHIAAGRPDEGRKVCQVAFRSAEMRGDAALMAEAALAYGAVYRFAEIDSELVHMLERAQLALGPAHPGLRARVMGRLAAAQQPAEDPRGPVRLAAEAIREAEAHGQDLDLMLTLRAASSAMVDMAAARTRQEVGARHLELGRRMASSYDIYRAQLRLAFDAFELGQLAEAEDHLSGVRALCAGDELPPRVRWRAAAVRALKALWSREDEPESWIDRARELGRAAGDGNAEVVWIYQRTQLAVQRGDAAGVHALEPHFSQMWSSSRVGRVMARTAWAGALLELGLEDAARETAPRGVLRQASALRDHTLLDAVARLAALYEDREAAAGVLAILDADDVQYIHRGVAGMTWVGRSTATRELVLRLEGSGSVSPSRVEGSEGPSFDREGEAWRVRFSGRSFVIRPSKGIDMLIHLIERPREDVHVLDLIHREGPASFVDRGEGDELLDARARADYKRRVVELQAELDAATEAHDIGRATTARAELETLTEALLASTGLGGRSRRAAGTEERARQNVRKRLKDAFRRIGAVDPELGRYLERSVRTGRFCRYEP